MGSSTNTVLIAACYHTLLSVYVQCSQQVERETRVVGKKYVKRVKLYFGEI
jgi:translation initiation factor IF-1